MNTIVCYAVAALLVLDVCDLTNAKKNRNRDCKYGQMVFEDCDATTNRRRITRTLNAGASTGTDCEQTVVVKDNVRCTPGEPTCFYKKIQWSDCNDSNQMTRTLPLKRRMSEANCDPEKPQTKACPAAGGMTCKYKKSAWSDCNPATNKKTRTLTLKTARSDSGCETPKTQTRNC